MAQSLTSNTGRPRIVTPGFVCKHCHKSFVKESAYLAHHCKQMKRFEEFQTPIGQAALGYYQRWMRTMKRNPPAATAFLESRYFRTFINFAQFVAKVALPMPEKFIWLMNEKKYPPTMWTTDDAYTQYIEFLDRKADPLDQVNLSIKTLLTISDAAECDVSDVFDCMRPTELMQLIRKRQLSPWLLLHSTKFKLYFRDKMSDEQKIILETLINPEYWSERFEQYEDKVEQIQMYVKEMGI